MSKGGGSQTQRTEPPKYAMPYLQTGMNEALRMYNGGNQAGSGSAGSILDRLRGTGGIFGGAPSVPGAGQSAPGQAGGIAGNPYQTLGNEIVLDRLAGGSPTIGAATDYVTNSLNGGFLGSNPYLDQAFEKARLATQTGLSSEFARSGRNVDQSEGLRAQQMNDLATSIYGGAYENERNRMQGVLPYAQPLGNQAYTDANVVGSLDTPQSTALDQYLSRINSSVYGANTRTGGSGFSGAGALGGAMLGNVLFPGIGGIIGGGLLGGLF